MHDENAFGLWVAYFDIEDDEYASDDTESFVARFSLFERLTLSYLADNPLAGGLRATSLGHALYVEWADGDQLAAPLAWLKGLRGVLAEHAFRATCALTHGGRWVGDELDSSQAGEVTVFHVSRPSEPFRRALLLDAATHGAPDEDSAWGPGLYVDTEAIEALKLSPKNKPTVWGAAGAEFFRLSAG